MTDPYILFFKSHPDPMWIFNIETLKFLEVNDAAVARYGYSEDEFRLMSITEIRPSEDIEALMARVAQDIDGIDQSGVWRHRLKSGEIIHVDTRASRIDYQSQKARLVCARDVTRLVVLEEENNVLLARETAARAEAEAAALHFQSLFESVPGKYLVMRAHDLSIVTASDEFLAATMTRRDDIVRKNIFEVFPDDPADAGANGVRILSESIARVIANRAADVMPVHRYPILTPADLGGGFSERYWTAVNAPVMGLNGQVAFVIHRVDDVTEFVSASADGAPPPLSIDPSGPDAAQHRLELLLHARELKESNDRLLERDRQLTNAQRIGHLGSWELDISRNGLSWSENVYTIFGTTPASFGHTFEHYLDLIHPADRKAFVTAQAEALAGRSALDIVQRIIRPDGEMRFVHEMGELIASPSGLVLSGAVQDITEAKVAERKAAETSFLIRAASRSARLGAWSVVLGEDTVTWSEETAAIHEVAPGVRPTVREALDYYAPEYRASMEAAFRNCLATGTPFDAVSQIVTTRGRRIWVRVVGEAGRDDKGVITGVQGALQDVSELIEAREESNRIYSRLHRNIDNISDGFITVDAELRFVFINREATRLFALDAAALIGKKMWDVFPEGVGTVFDAKYAFAMETRTPVTFVEYFDPIEKWLNIRAYPTDDGLAIYFQDITGQRAQHEQLQLLQTAIAHLQDVVLICEAATLDEGGPKIVYVNEAFEHTTGYAREEAIGKTPRMLQGAKTERRELDRIRAALVAGTPVRAELINYTKTGREYWLELEIVPIANENGVRTHFVAIERDITARKTAEQTIAVGQERFRLIAQATSDIVWDWDIAAGTVWWNEGFRKILGYDPEQFSQDPLAWSVAFHPDDRDRVLTGIGVSVEGTDDSWADEYRFKRTDGSYADIRDHAFIIRGDAGRALRMVGSMVDVTKQKKLEAELRQAQRLEAVGQLTGGIAHDFNNLLTVILGNSEAIAERLQNDETIRPLAEMTRTAAERAADLTSRLLSFSRKQALDPRSTDLNKLIVDMEGLLRRALGAQLDIKIVKGDNLKRASVDGAQLENALLNLCLNARDAMPDGGLLTIETANIELDQTYLGDNVDAVAGDYVMVAISDTGSGMDAETITRAFEPFFTTKEVGKGSGLGLSMVYGFIRQSRGHIKIYSEPGRGTTIRLYLPAAAAEMEHQREPIPQEHESGGGLAKILLVEDDELVRNHVAAQLQSLGYAVVCAEDGRRALQILRETDDFALLLTDIVMPGGINGRQVATEARQLYPHLPVLFTSGYTEDAIVHDGRLDQGVHLLTKPYRKKDLASKVREVLDAT